MVWRICSTVMGILYPLLAFARRKATWCAVVAGLLVATACWWWLPPTPRTHLPLPPSPSMWPWGMPKGMVFSPDFHYAIDLDDGVLYDIIQSRKVFSIPAEAS